MPERDSGRDRSVDHMLRRVLSEGSSAPAESTCVDGETLAAWMSKSLHAKEAAGIERHVADCVRCQAMMAAFVRTDPVVPTPESIWRRWRLGWLVPLATAATAASLWIALPGTSTLPAGMDSARSTVAVEPQSPPPATSAPASVPPAVERATPVAPLRQEKATALADNDAPEQRDQTALRERVEGPLAAAAPDAPSQSAETEADRRDSRANSTAETFAAARTFVMPLEIVAPGGAARWRIVNGRQVERTTSGTEWTTAVIDSSDVLTTGVALSPSVCWIIGRRGAVYLTTDGSRFVRLPFPESADLVLVTAIDDQMARVSAADGRSWQTADQGRTWSPAR